MTTGGEGGMVTTQNDNLWRKMWAYKDHGKSLKLFMKESMPWVLDGFMKHLEETRV